MFSVENRVVGSYKDSLLILLTAMSMKTIRVYHRHKKQYHFVFQRRRLYALTADSAIFSTCKLPMDRDQHRKTENTAAKDK